MTDTKRAIGSDVSGNRGKIRVLILNDSATDAEMLVHKLIEAGYVLEWERVQSEPDYLAAIDSIPDLILADCRLPQFDGLRALALLRERLLDIPFIFVSGSVGEEIAVSTIKLGADDFLLKDRMARFGAAVSNALEIKRMRDERKKAEQKRAAVEILFENLTTSSLVGIQILQDGRYVYANSKVAEIFGYTEAEILALDSWTAVVAEEDRERVLDQVRRRVSGETPHAHYFFRGLRKDRSVIDVEVRSDRVELHGRPAVLGMLVDVTEHRRAAESLRASEERFRNAFEFTNVPMVLTDLEHRFVRVNEAFAKMFGYSQMEMLEMSVSDITHPDDLRESYGRRVALLEGQTNYFQMEKRYIHRDGHIIWGLANVSLIRDARGQPQQYVGEVQDITERKQSLERLNRVTQDLRAANVIIDQERAQLAQRVAERTAELIAANAQLDQANRYKSEFLATMSHELRTPLNGILGMNELLQRTELDARQRRLVEACTTSGKTLLQLVNDVLDLSRIEAGKLELNLRECSLEALVYDVLAVFSYAAQQKHLTLTCDLDPLVCATAQCDDHRLRQILVNLLGNAIKFTDSGGVTVRAKYHKSDDGRVLVRFSVTDSGMGIPQDACERLFTPFSQADIFTAQQFGGSGLGLAISKQLTELMGGTIGMESQVGIGSTFWFEVPLQFSTVDSDLQRIRQVLGGARVLAIDGIDREREQIGDCLRAWGCPTQQVATAREALDAIIHAEAEGNPFGAVLVDCRLTIGDEYIVLQKLAAIPRLPLIGLGAEEDNESAAHLMLLGVRHILRDPVRPSALFDALSSVLSVSMPPLTIDPAPTTPTDPVEPIAAHILLAEDNHINQLFVVELLKYCGCTYEVASNGHEVLAAMQRNHFDLVLMDCHMPEMDGFAAAREIRRLEAELTAPRHVHIIALTANALKGDRERCLAAGMDDYLSKPLKADRLHKTLETYLRK